MSAKIFVLIEDNVETSHYQFWDLINKNIYNNILHIEPCAGVFKAKSKFLDIYNNLSDNDKLNSIFIFVLDNVLDNYRVERALAHLKINILDVYKNTYLLPILCFENILLSFDDLTSWLYCEDYQNLEKTKERLKLLDDYRKNNWETDRLLKCFNDSNCFTSEHLSCSVLSKITSNTSFHISKRELGLCFKIGCEDELCPYLKDNNKNIPLNKRCGLWSYKLTLEEKVKILYKNSCLNFYIKESKKYFLDNNYEIANNLVVFE